MSLILLSIGVAGSLGLHLLAGVPLGLSLLIFFVGWPLVGTLVTSDDDLKGGWSNPDGTATPDWLRAPFWGQIVGGVALSLVGGAIDVGWPSRQGAVLLGLGAAAALLAVWLWRRQVPDDAA